MGCNCGKPKCNGKCGCKSPAVLQINNPAEYITFHKVVIPASLGDSKTYPPRNGMYRNVLTFYEADQTSWLYSTDGIPTNITGATGPQGEQGEQGVAGTVAVGTTTTGDAGTDASVENVGTAENAILNFTIPRGEQGIQGETGPQGYMNEQDVRDVVDTIVPNGFFTEDAASDDCDDHIVLENMIEGAPNAFSISGESTQQTYTGKNLFDRYHYSVERKYIDADGTETTSNGFAISNFIPVTAGSKYTYSGTTNRDTYGAKAAWYDSSKQWLSSFGFNQSGTVTAPADAAYVRFSIRNAYTATGDATTMQVEAGEQATSYEPFVGGIPAPNPEYKEPVNSVTGGQFVRVSGKNLLDTKNLGTNTNLGITGTPQADGSIRITGTATSNGNAKIVPLTNHYNEIAAGTYTFSGSISGGFDPTKIYLHFNMSNGNTINLSANNTTATLAAPSTSYDIRMTVTSGTEYDLVFYPQLERGSSASDFEPYEGGLYEVNLGKNLFNLRNVTSGTRSGVVVTNNDGSISVSGTASANVDMGQVISLDASGITPGTYTVSSNVPLPTGTRVQMMFYSRNTYKSTFIWLAAGESSRTANISVIPPYVDTVKMYFTIVSGATVDFSNITIQLERGNQATSYAKYVKPTFLRGLSDEYKDKLFKDGDTFKIRRMIDEIVLNGNESNYTSIADLGSYTRVSLDAGEPMVNNIGASDSFRYIDDYNLDASHFYITNGHYYLFVPTAELDTVDEDGIKTWLSQHTPKMYYALATPVDEVITDSELLKQLGRIELVSGQNIVSISSLDMVGGLCIGGNANNWEGNLATINEELDRRVFKFRTAQELISSGFLKDGDIAKTAGYYEVGDGGAGDYFISSTPAIADGGSVIDLSNGLQANLIIKNDVVNVKQFGAKGDGVTDDSAAIQAALAYNGNNKSIVKFVKGETYRVDNNFYIYSNTTVDLNECIVKDVDGGPFNTSYNRVQFMNNLDSMTVAGYGALKNFVVKNGTFDGNTGGVAFPLFHAQDCRFENINFNNCFVSTHVFDLAGCNNITIKNCKFIGNLLSVAGNNFREVIQPDYATYGAAPYWGDDESFAFDALPTDGLTVDGCVFKKNDGDTYYLNGVGTHAANEAPHNNIVVKNCEFYDCQYSCIRLMKANNVLIENNTFYNIRTDRTTDNYAINITNEGGSGIMALHDVVIRGNKYISTQTTTDQIFLRIHGRTSYLTTGVIVENNIYNGTAISEAEYLGNDCAHMTNLDGAIFRNNVINRSKAVVFTVNMVMSDFKFVDNICNNCLRGVRSNASTTDTTSNAYPAKFTWANNTWSNPNGSIDTSGTSWILGLDEDVSFSDASSTFHRLPIKVKSGIDLYIGANNDLLIPSYIKRIKVAGYVSVTTESGSTVEYVESSFYNRILQQNNPYRAQVNEDTAGVARSFSTGEFTVEQNNFLWNYFSTSADRLWKDGNIVLGLGLRSVGNVTVNAADTRLIIEAF